MGKQGNIDSDSLILESIKIQYMDEGAQKGVNTLRDDLYRNLHLKITPPEKISEGTARLGIETGDIIITIILAPFVHDAVVSILNRLKEFFKKWRTNFPGGQVILKQNKDDPGNRFPFIKGTDVDEFYDFIKTYMERKKPKTLSEWIEKVVKERKEISKLYEKEATFLDVDVVGSRKLRETEADLLVSAYSFEQYHKYITEVVGKNNGKVLDAIGDEVMAWFLVPDDAINCAHEIFRNREEFNKNNNKMNASFQFRIGINTGIAFIDENQGKAFSRGVLDLAEHLQEKAVPGTFLISQYTYNKLENQFDFHRNQSMGSDNAQSYVSKHYRLPGNENNNQEDIGQDINRGGDIRKNLVTKILILAANPKTTPPLRLDEEVREIEEGLQRAKHRDRFDIRSKWAVRIRDIRRALLDYEPHIVHFIGHGRENGLLVEDEVGSPVRISAKALSGLFQLFSKHVECVIMSACYAARQAAVISKHIPYVIGMRKKIEDKAALEFSVGFYDALGAGKPVEEAFKFGCSAIQFFNISEKNFPLIFKKPGHFQTENSGPPTPSTTSPPQPRSNTGTVINAINIGKINTTADGDIITNETIYKYYAKQKEKK